MRAVVVDFAPPPAWRGRWLWGAALLMSGLALGQGWLLVREVMAWRTVTAQADVLHARLEAARANAATPAPPPASDPREVEWQRLAELSTFDPGDVLRAVESGQVPGVHVTAIEVDAAARHARVLIELGDASASAAYLAALNAGAASPAWRLAALRSQGGRLQAEFVLAPSR